VSGSQALGWQTFKRGLFTEVKVEEEFFCFVFLVFLFFGFGFSKLVHHEGDDNCEDGSEHHVAACGCCLCRSGC